MRQRLLNLHPNPTGREVALQLCVDVRVLGRVGVEGGEHCLLMASLPTQFLQIDLGITVVAERSLKGNVAEHLRSTDRALLW